MKVPPARRAEPRPEVLGHVPLVQLHGDWPLPRVDDLQRHAEEGDHQARQEAHQGPEVS